MKITYRCETCLHDGDRTGKCVDCVTSLDTTTGQQTMPSHYEFMKCCQTCKHDGLASDLFPCNACRDDDHGEPTRWEAVMTEAVDHPQHYNHGKYECIDVMVENFGKEATQHFCLLNAFKYVWRTNYKNGVEDVKKAWWYLDKYLKLEGNDE